MDHFHSLKYIKVNKIIPIGKHFERCEARKNALLPLLSEEPDKFYNDLGYINSDLNLNNLHISNVNLLNQKEINQYIKDIEPDYIFNLSGPSSVYNSYKNPEKTISNIKTIFDNLINACVEQNNFCNFFQASSSEMFKESNEVLDETSSFGPISPYAKAKYDVHIYLNDLRAKFDWNINSGIMFNHESEFRDDDYLFMKIINAAINIKHGKEKELIIGSLDIKRDWSYAKDVVEAISLITEEKICPSRSSTCTTSNSFPEISMFDKWGV